MSKNSLDLLDAMIKTGQTETVLDCINALDLTELPPSGEYERSPYHILSEALCSLERVGSEWAIDKVAPAILKWLVNEGAETGSGIPSIAHHLLAIRSISPDKFIIFRNAFQKAILLFTYCHEVTTSETALLCMTDRKEDRNVVNKALDHTFRSLSPSQGDWIFSEENTVALSWLAMEQAVAAA